MVPSRLLKRKWIITGGLVLAGGLILIMIWIHRSSNNVISEDKFVDVYVKLSLAQELFTSDSLKLKEEKKKIFEQVKVTPEQVDLFVSRYNLKPEQWVDVWKRILEKLEQEKQKLRTP